MEQRKFFKYRITELEEIYGSSQTNVAVLEELHHRSTQRAGELLKSVQNSLKAVGGVADDINNDPGRKYASPAPSESQPVFTPPTQSAIPILTEKVESDIDWSKILSDEQETATTSVTQERAAQQAFGYC